MAYASVNDLEELKEASKDYLKYSIKKDKIKEKYSEDIFPTWNKEGSAYSKHGATKEQREQYRLYLKEIGDLIFEPQGDYQKFCWDFLISDSDKAIMEQRARGSMREGSKY